MGIESLHAGVEREGAAIFTSRFHHELVEKLPAEAARPISFARHQIDHVKRPPGE